MASPFKTVIVNVYQGLDGELNLHPRNPARAGFFVARFGKPTRGSGPRSPAPWREFISPWAIMPIETTDIVFRLSGGASNTNPLASLGGAKSATLAASNIFDDVGGAESGAGDTEYRCIYVHNAHASLTLTGATAYIGANTPSADTQAAIGVGTSAVNGTEQAVANEGAAPAGVSFSEAASKGAGIALGDIPAGQHRALWVRRVVNPGAAAAASDSFVINVFGDTAA